MKLSGNSLMTDFDISGVETPIYVKLIHVYYFSFSNTVLRTQTYLLLEIILLRGSMVLNYARNCQKITVVLYL
jgi:hypothetical protein